MRYTLKTKFTFKPRHYMQSRVNQNKENQLTLRSNKLKKRSHVMTSKIYLCGSIPQQAYSFINGQLAFWFAYYTLDNIIRLIEMYRPGNELCTTFTNTNQHMYLAVTQKDLKICRSEIHQTVLYGLIPGPQQ